MKNVKAAKTIAVIMAHPDDEVLGCGGSISRLVREGNVVHIFIMASGLTSRGPTENSALIELKIHAEKAVSRLGATSIEFADFPDNSMDGVNLLDVVKRIELYLKKTKPDVIFTHHHGDINIDHDITQRAVMTATRALPNSKTIEVFACEILSSSEFGPAHKRLQPHVYIRLSEEDVDAATQALACYESECCDWPHPRSIEALKS